MIRIGNLIVMLNKLCGVLVDTKIVETLEENEENKVYSLIILLENQQPISVEYKTEEEMNLNLMRIESELIKKDMLKDVKVNSDER